MAKVTPLINNFNGGELCPKIDARSDYVKYPSGCRTLQNAIPLVEGGAMKMPGTKFVAEVKDSDKFTRSISFHFSTIQGYTLEFGDKYIRYYYKDAYGNKGQIVVAYSAWANGIVYALGALVTSGGLHYRCIVAHTSGVFATDLTALKWELTKGATDLAYEIPTPYLEADLSGLKVTQSADILFIFHHSYPPMKLTRTGHTAWTLNYYLCAVGVEMVITGISQAATAVVTCVNVPDSLDVGDVVYLIGVVGMTQVNNRFFTVGAIVAGAGGTFELAGVNSTTYTAYTSDGTAQGTLFGVSGKNPSCGTFYEQRMMIAGCDNYPQRIDGSHSGDYYTFTLDSEDSSAGIQYTIVSDRVDRIRWLIAQEVLMAGTFSGIWKVFSGSAADPISQDNIDCKRQTTLGVKDLDPELVADAILCVTRAGTGIRKIEYRWEKDKWIPTSMTKAASHIAMGATRALSGIDDMDFQNEPMPILWAVRADGQLIGMSYDTQEEVFGFFRIVTDGYFESVSVISNENDEDEVWVIAKRTIGVDTKRYVEYFMPHEFFSQIKDCFFMHSGLTYDGGAACIITGITNANPAVVTSAGHTFVNGNKVRIIGVLGMTQVNQGLTAYYTVANAAANTFELSGINSSVHSAWAAAIVYAVGDCVLQGGVDYKCIIAHTSGVFADDLAAGKWIITIGWGVYVSGGTAQKVTNRITGLDHLDGKSVMILVDGTRHPNQIVAGGYVDLSYCGNLIHAGLPAVTIVEPMKVKVDTGAGTSLGRKQKITRLHALFYETFGVESGPDIDNLNEIEFGTGVTPALYTGIKEIEHDGDWGEEAKLCFVSSTPFPMTLLAVVPELHVEGR